MEPELLTLKIVIAEQDMESGRQLGKILEEEGFRVLQAADGEGVLQLAFEEKPDFIIMDKMVPPAGGLRVCRKIRSEPDIAHIPIIILSANEDISERILTLNAGADDYIVKPLNVDELIARLKALQRRAFHLRSVSVIRAGNIEVDLERWTVSVEGRNIILTSKEFSLLKELIEAKGRVLTRDALLERIWGREKELDISTRTVDIHLSRLRIKLGRAGNQIITVRNVGYRIDFSPAWLVHKSYKNDR